MKSAFCLVMMSRIIYLCRSTSTDNAIDISKLPGPEALSKPGMCSYRLHAHERVCMYMCVSKPGMCSLYIGYMYIPYLLD